MNQSGYPLPILWCETAFNNAEPKDLQVYYHANDRKIRLMPSTEAVSKFLCGRDVFVYEYRLAETDKIEDELERLRINKIKVYTTFVDAYNTTLLECLE